MKRRDRSQRDTSVVITAMEPTAIATVITVVEIEAQADAERNRGIPIVRIIGRAIAVVVVVDNARRGLVGDSGRGLVDDAGRRGRRRPGATGTRRC